MSIEVKYGYHKSEPNITHLWIKVDRDWCCLTTSAVIYRHSILLQDVTRHTFGEEDGHASTCDYSPSGWCYTYDEVRWTNLDVSLSDWLVYNMLVERLNQALRDEKTITPEEQVEILRGMSERIEWEG
jgi:hypothetical protein